jgi:phosphonate transport system ATP-binding protein
MLKIVKLSKHYGSIHAVDEVSLDIPEGQMVGIIGRSGAGKSTLLSLLNRLVEPTSGALYFRSHEITGLKGKALLRWRSQCAMIFQQFNLVHRLSVLENVLAGRLNHNSGISSLLKIFPALDRARAIKALDRLGMADFAFQRADQLSGGQQQRVAIARALVQSPKIVLADEPIASLDPHNAKLVMEALRSINRDNGLTVIANLHTLDTARTYCERIVGMAQGKVVFDGGAHELTPGALYQIYGSLTEADQDAEQAIDESITSTALNMESFAASSNMDTL